MNLFQEAFQRQLEKHKVFVSYYHNDDQRYRDAFEKHFGSLFISKSVQPGDIDTDVGDEYIKHLIQDDYLDDASVIIVLVGPKTLGRKHVDWEISAGLNKKVSGYSGLMAILLPEYRLSVDGKYQYDEIPARLADNVKTDYAKVYTWAWLCADAQRVKNAIQTAFDDRIKKADKIDNSRKQMQGDTCS